MQPDATTTAARLERAIWTGLPASRWQEEYRAECLERVLQVVDGVVREEHDRLRNPETIERASQAVRTCYPLTKRQADTIAEAVVLALLGESTKEGS